MIAQRRGRRAWRGALPCAAALGLACEAGGQPSGGQSSGGESGVSVHGSVMAGWISGVTGELEGAVVEVVGEPSASAVTDEDGDFTIDGLKPGEVVWFAAAPSEAHLGAVFGVEIPPGDLRGLTIVQLLRAQLLADFEALQAVDPDIAYDEARGSILVSGFGSAATIGLHPMPPPGHVYGLARGGTPVLDATSSDDLVPAVVFFGLDPVDADAIELSVTEPILDCEIPLPRPPIRADHVSYVGVECGPP